MTDRFLPEFADVLSAAARLKGVVRETPVVEAPWLAEAIGAAAVYFKCESMQHAGAFKYRGASNAVLSLGEEDARRGVATHSSGNHGAALALAAKRRGIAAHVVVPNNAPPVKIAAIKAAGATVHLSGPETSDREAAVATVLRDTGATLVHPFDNARVIAGQGTATLELLSQAPSLDTVMAPVSGGGLMCGTAIASHGVNPLIKLFGAEPQLADDAARSLRSGALQPAAPTSSQTIADGLRASLCDRTFAILHQHRVEPLLVSESQIVEAMMQTWERSKLVIEPSAAVTVAAMLAHPGHFMRRRVGAILSGGNLQLDKLPWQ